MKKLTNNNIVRSPLTDYTNIIQGSWERIQGRNTEGESNPQSVLNDERTQCNA
jgi:hypothetical protein